MSREMMYKMEKLFQNATEEEVHDAIKTEYKVFERIGKDQILRMVTENEMQAEAYLAYVLCHCREAWMEVV